MVRASGVPCPRRRRATKGAVARRVLDSHSGLAYKPGSVSNREMFRRFLNDRTANHTASYELAVLKSGKFHVVLDASYPRDRLEAMLGDSGAKLIVTDSGSFALARQLSGDMSRFKVELPIKALWEAPTVAQTAEVLSIELRRTIGDEDLARSLNDIETLSGAEIRNRFMLKVARS